METRIDRIQQLSPGAYPVASDDAVQVAERALGFALPPLLRDLYRTVGNGGFGPGYGIIGLDGGHPADYYGVAELSLSGLYHTVSERPPAYVFNGVISWDWPTQLLPFCFWGCGIYACAFCREENAPVYVYDSNIPEDGAILIHTTTLAEWLDRWLAGEDLWRQMRRLTPS